MQKITHLKYITSSLSVLVLLSTTAMAMDLNEEVKTGGAFVHQTPPTEDTTIGQTSTVVTQEAAKEDEYEDVKSTVTRSWLNPGWITRGPTYEVTVRQKKVAPPPVVEHEKKDEQAQQSVTTPVNQQEQAPPAIAPQETAKEDEYEDVKKTVTRSWLNPGWITRGSTYEVTVRQKKVVPGAGETTVTSSPAGEGDQQEQSSTVGHPADNLTDTFFTSVARVYEAAGENSEAKDLLDRAMDSIAKKGDKKEEKRE